MTPDRQDCPHEQDAVLLALHVLDGEEAAAAARHVRSCRFCRATVRDVEETFAEVGESAALAPPPRLRERIMAATQPEPAATATRLEFRRARTAPPPQAEPRRGPRRWVMAAAAALLVAGLAGGGIAIAQLDSQRDASTVHAGTVDDLLVTIAASPHAVLVDPGRHPVAAVVLDDAPRFYALAVPTPSPGRMWVLWGARGPASTALAMVPPGRDGVAVPVPGGRPGEYEAYLLTQEPTGPLPSRRGEVVASGPATGATAPR